MTLRHAVLAALALGLVCGPWAYGQSDDDQHIINLDEAEIAALIDDVAMVTGYTFVVHPDVRGKVTVNSQAPLSRDELFQVFLSTLRVQGYAAVPDGKGVFRIVPEKLAAGDAGLRAAEGGVFMTQAFKLRNFSAFEASKLIKPLLGPEGRVVANPASDVLIAVEYPANMARVRSLVGELDVDRSVTRTVALKSMPANEMADILNGLDIGGAGAERTGRGFSVVSSPSSSAIILRGEAEAIEQALRVVYELDEAPSAGHDTRVITLSHSNAALLAPVLQQVADTASGGGAAAGDGGPPTVISVHEPTNSLIISASASVMTAIEEVISELDVRRKQVLVEALVAQVSDDTARELGVQFVLSGSEGNLPFASTNFADTSPNILALTGALLDGSLTDGDDPTPSPFEQAAVASILGFDGLTLGGGGQSGETLFGAVVTALQTDEDTNILSTPSVLTLDNEPALLSVGQEIPVTAGEVVPDTNINPFRTVERQQIGVILTVTPRVGEDNTVRLEIDQEVSSIAAQVGTAVTPDFILNQSRIQTNVVADNGELIVLGGLIEATESFANSQVPLLGDIPGLGKLFQSKGTARENSNLMLFIRPTIIEDSQDARRVTDRSYNFLRAQQILAGNGDPPSIDAFVESVLEGQHLPGYDEAEVVKPSE